MDLPAFPASLGLGPESIDLAGSLDQRSGEAVMGRQGTGEQGGRVKFSGEIRLSRSRPLITPGAGPAPPAECPDSPAEW